MIGNHARLSWLPVRVESSSSETGWRKWVDWLIASCRLWLFSLMAALGADVLLQTFAWDEVWRRCRMLPIYRERLSVPVKIMASGRRRSVWSLQVVRRLALCPEGGARVAQSVTTEEDKPPRVHVRPAQSKQKAQKNSQHRCNIFYFFAVSLIQGRKTKQRRKPLFSTKGSEEKRKKEDIQS